MKRKKEKNHYELLKESIRLTLIEQGMWLPQTKIKPSKKRFKRVKFKSKFLY